MYTKTIFTILILLVCAGIAFSASQDTKAGEKRMGISPKGIACFTEETIDYRRPGKPRVRVHFGEPVTVVVAPEPVKWGPYQFPGLTRWTDGTIQLSYSISPDSAASYGNPSGRVVSTDGGKSWTPAEGKSGISGLLLPNGDRIAVTTPRAFKVSEIKLPEPVGRVMDTYARSSKPVYRLTELSPELASVRIKRLPKGSSAWQHEQAKLDDPQALRYTTGDLFPIVWWGDVRVAPDDSVIAGIYPGFLLKEDGTADPKGHVFFYRSTDSGRVWKIQGRILYQPDLELDPRGDERGGFTEPAYDILADGSFLCVMRTTDGIGIGPMYASRSTDLGKSWSKPEVIAGNGVLPKLLRLENGVEVLSSGRPGVQIRFATDVKADLWTDPFEMVPVTTSDVFQGADTCGYTSLLATGPDSFLIACSHFKYQTPDGLIRKAIKVREIRVTAVK